MAKLAHIILAESDAQTSRSGRNQNLAERETIPIAVVPRALLQRRTRDGNAVVWQPVAARRHL